MDDHEKWFKMEVGTQLANLSIEEVLQFKK